MTDSNIPDPALAALQQRADDITAKLAALDTERDEAIASFRARRKNLQRELRRIDRAAREYRGETERGKKGAP